MSDPVLEAQGVTVRFGRVQAVEDASLALNRGEVVGLVGESGSGKTTLCRALLGLQPVTAGEVRLEGRALTRWPGNAMRRQLQMLLQDATSSLSPRKTLRFLLTEPLHIHGMPRRAGWAAMEALLLQLGLPPDLLDKYPHQISGGQARRVAIARALILNPAVLVADEPTAGLDLSVQGEVLNLLLDLQTDRGLAMLIVSHNLNVVRRVTSRTVVMYLGQVLESGDSAGLFARPAHPYTAALLAANPAIRAADRHKPIILEGDVPNPAAPPPACRFHTRCPAVQPVCRMQSPDLAEVAPGRLARCHFPLV
jgi:peptide/nickel transport system ATP-binding protein